MELIPIVENDSSARGMRVWERGVSDGGTWAGVTIEKLEDVSM